jgi:UDP-glucose:(heptosyl)LPS alpha-1,3-glucosyltransferase
VRLAMVVHDYGRAGGHSRYVTALASRFALEHDVHVFANRFGEPPPPGVHLHRVPAVRITALTTILSFPAGLVGRLRGFDVVHAQGFCAPHADVVTAHICNARWLEARQQSGSGALWRDGFFARPVVALERRVFTAPRTRVIAVSDVVRRDIERLYDRHEPTTVIHHGVDLAQFNAGVRDRYREATRHALGTDDDTTVLLYVGDLRKGARTLIHAAARVPRAVVLLVTRTDPAAWLAEAHATGLGGRVRAVAPTDQIECYYAAADIFVLPTPYDAFGMVVTEAMACALPVVTTRQAGASEVIADGRTGVVLDDAFDADALADALLRLVADPAARARIGAAAAVAMQEHSWDRVADRTMRVYEQALAAK